MFQTVQLPIWALVLILAFAGVTFASHFLFPSVRWFFRRRMERAVSELNKRLQRPVEPFKLLERHDRILRLVYDPKVMEAVVEYAHETGIPENVAFQRARRYAREIVPGFSASIYFGFSVRLARWLSRLLYTVRVNGADDSALSDADPNATVIFVINHRSNMDYVLVTWLISSRMTLSYAVGEWARVWPLSFLIRAMGAYFIRRRNLNPLYRRVLERYVQMATREGVAQAIFPEGGLSLDGRVGPAKLGLLSYILAEGKRGGRDLVFVPVGLGYDRVLEDRLLVQAGVTGVRRFKVRLFAIMIYVASMLWRRLWGRWKGFGKVGVSFGQPVSLRAVLAQEGDISPEEMGRRLMENLRAVVPLLPVPLVAHLVMSGGAKRETLEQAFRELTSELRAKGAVLTLPNLSIAETVENALRPLLKREIVLEGPTGLVAHPGDEDLLAFHAAPVQQFLDAHAAKSPQGESSET
jgi:glycerol-3-phosphate O-acyltransferase